MELGEAVGEGKREGLFTCAAADAPAGRGSSGVMARCMMMYKVYSARSDTPRSWTTGDASRRYGRGAQSSSTLCRFNTLVVLLIKSTMTILSTGIY